MQFIFRFLIFLPFLAAFLPEGRSQLKLKKQVTFDKEVSIPLIFRENKGQWHREILYKAVSSNSQLYFSKNQIHFTHSRLKNLKDQHPEQENLNWSFDFIGANKNVKVKGEGAYRSTTNYLVGNDASTHLHGVKDYNILSYSNLYPEIDLKYYTSEDKLKYDYILHPGFKLSDIRVKCSGIKNIRIVNEELEIEHDWGIIKEKKPYSYQWIDGKAKEIKISYRLIDANTFGYWIEGAYDPTKDIILDPVTLVWGTYVGGSNPTNGGYLYDLTTDRKGNIYATGYYPNTFPTTFNAYDKSFNGGYGDAFVFKLNSNGQWLEYATYIGGNDDDRGNGIAVNQNGEAYITGYTSSPFNSFPVTKIFGTTLTGQNAFVCKLSSDGSSLIYSAYIGGLDHDIANAIVVDKSGNAYVAGETQSTNFPVTSNAFDNSFNGTPSDGFIIKLNAAGTALNYCSYLGGSSDDRARALAINSNNEVFVTGATRSSDFPTSPTSFDKTQNGDYDIFVSKISSSGNSLLYSTFIGGIAAEEGTSIDFNAQGDAFITGYSFSNDYPKTVGNNISGLNDVIVTRLDPTGSNLIYSRFIGGNQKDEGTSIIINEKDQAFIAGTTKSKDFPIVLSNISDPDPLKDKEYQVFALMLGETGALIKKSIKIGGSYDDYKIPNLSFPNKKNICDVIIGFTSHSPDLPTTGNTFQPKKLNGDQTNDQPAVFKLYFGPDSIPMPKTPLNAYCEKDSLKTISLCGPAGNDPDYPYSYLWSNGSTSICVSIPNKDSDINLIVTDGCHIDTARFAKNELKPPSITFPTSNFVCKGGTYELKPTIGGDGPFTFQWSNGSSTANTIVTSPGKYWLKVTSLCGEDTDTVTVNTADLTDVSIGQDKAYCFPGTYTLTASVSNPDLTSKTFLWSTGETTDHIMINKGGSYWVKVKNLCGTSISTINISELTKPIVNLGNDTSICQNGSVVLNAGNPGLPKSWSTGEKTNTITITTPGVYWVDVTNVCGTTRDSIVIQTSMNVPMVNLGPDQTICQPFNLTLDAGNSTNGSNYYWSTGETSRQINVNKGGTYFVTVTNGCGIGRDTILITAPPALTLDLGPDQALCAPQTLALSAVDPGGKVTYLWSTGSKSNSIIVSSTGKYWVKVSNSCGTASDTVRITVQNSLPKVNLGNDTLICPNTDFKLNAGDPGFAYLWNTQEITQTITVNIAQRDTFWVDVTNACGTVRDSIILDLTPLPTVSLGADTSICFPATLKLDATFPKATYHWNTGATSSSINISTTGKYYVDVTRCITVSDTILVTSNTITPKINLGKDTTICTNFSITLDAGINPGANYEWTPGGENTQSIKVSKGQMYSVKVTNGCGSTIDSLNVIGQPYQNLGPDLSACKLDTVILDAGNQWSNAKYKWNTNDTTQMIKVHQSGEYIVEVLNICGITRDTILISMDTIKCKVELGPDHRICSPMTSTLDAENPGSTYAWSTGEKTRTITVSKTGMYKVLVTNGCGVTPDSVFVIVDKNKPVVDLGPDQKLCSPINQVIDAGSPGNIFKWYPDGQTTEKITVKSGGTYSVRVDNACGYDSTGLKITEYKMPQVELGKDTAVCMHALTLDAKNVGDDYFWSTGETTEQISVNTTGNYKLNVYNVCGIITDSIFVVIDNGIPSVDLGKDTMLCSPSGLVLNAGSHPLGKILWQPSNDSTEKITVKNAGIYSVNVINSCGNTSDAIQIDPNPVSVQAEPDTAICPGNSVQLTTVYNSSYQYKWIPSNTLNKDTIYNPIATPHDTTTYYLNATDGICYNTDSAKVIVYPIYHSEIIATPIEGYLPLGVQFSNKHTAPKQLWIFGDGDSSTAKSPAHVYTKESIFKAILITATENGCTETDTVEIRPFTLFIPNLITPNNDQHNDRFDLTNQYVWLYVEIFNRWGDLIFQKDGYLDEWDATGCPDGIYYYHILDKKYLREFKGWVQVVRSTQGRE